MTFLAVVSVAAICASLVWYERRVVSRHAFHRRVDRRQRQPWESWDDLIKPTDAPTRRLSGAIETAVLAGDVAFAYRDRLGPGIAKGESPFQFRRGRIDASVRRYRSAVEYVTDAAQGWLEAVGDEPCQQRAAVQRMVDFLRDDAAQPEAAMERIDAGIDVFENTLANLRQGPHRQATDDPFR